MAQIHSVPATFLVHYFILISQINFCQNNIEYLIETQTEIEIIIMIVISSLSFLLLSIILHYSLAHENRVKITPVARTENKSLRGYSQNEDQLALNEFGEKEGFVSFPEMNITTGSIEVTFFDDEESIKFYRETSWETINGFAWYGEDGNKTSSLNLSVRKSDDGTRYAG